MIRKLVCAVVVLVVALGLVALISSPIDARGCKPDPNPDHGRDHFCIIDCPPCTFTVCTPGGRCPFTCEPIPDCTPPQG